MSLNTNINPWITLIHPSLLQISDQPPLITPLRLNEDSMMDTRSVHTPGRTVSPSREGFEPD